MKKKKRKRGIWRMNNMLIVAVDTGNKFIKTPHTEPFNAGLVEHGKTEPPISVDTIVYEGNYFSLTENRIPVMYDKTTNDAYFILTLFAAARELIAMLGKRDSYNYDICLAVGLPPAHLHDLKGKYVDYFKRGGKVSFKYNSSRFELNVVRVEVYAQGFAAIVPHLATIKTKARSFIVDIDGYTTDVIKLNADGIPDLDFCESYNYGVIRLFDQVQRAVRNKWHQDLDDYMVEAILQGKIDPGELIRNTVNDTVRQYAKNLIHTLQEKGVDLSIAYPIFLGGGSLLMKESIAAELHRDDYLVIEDVRANAIGYALLTRAKLGNTPSSNKV